MPKARNKSIMPPRRTRPDPWPSAYEVPVPDATMEPSFTKGYGAHITPNRAPRKGDEVFFRMASKRGGETKAYIKELVSFNQKTLKVSQLKPKKTRTFARKDVVLLHRVGGAWTISPERVREMANHTK